MFTIKCCSLLELFDNANDTSISLTLSNVSNLILKAVNSAAVQGKYALQSQNWTEQQALSKIKSLLQFVFHVDDRKVTLTDYAFYFLMVRIWEHVLAFVGGAKSFSHQMYTNIVIIYGVIHSYSFYFNFIKTVDLTAFWWFQYKHCLSINVRSNVVRVSLYLHFLKSFKWKLLSRGCHFNDWVSHRLSSRSLLQYSDSLRSLYLNLEAASDSTRRLFHSL